MIDECAIISRSRLSGAAAREHGLRIVGGQLHCRPHDVGCDGPLGEASMAYALVLTPACGFWTDRLLVVGRTVYEWTPQSVGERGGPGWSLTPTRVTDPRGVRPLGFHFFTDGARVYRDGPVESADPVTFRVLDCPEVANRCVACDAAACFREQDHGWAVERVEREASR